MKIFDFGVYAERRRRESPGERQAESLRPSVLCAGWLVYRENHCLTGFFSFDVKTGPYWCCKLG